MRYSDDLVEEIRMKNDIVDVISGYVKLTRRGSSYFGLCPFHNEKSPSFSVSPGKQMYYCFGCGAGGNVFTFLMEYENFTFVEALKFLADRDGVELPQMEYSKEAKEQADLKNTLLEINKQAAKFYYYQLHTERGKQGYDYLKGRGLSDDTIRKFGLGYSDKYGSLLSRFLKEIPLELLETGPSAKKEKKEESEQVRVKTSFMQAKETFKTKAFTAPKPVQQFGTPKGGKLPYGVGDRVRHIKFGEGTVTAIIEGGRDYEVTVHFDGPGTKKMFATFARLQKV